MTWIWCQKLQIQIVLIISEISQIVSHWVPGSLPTTSGVMYPRSRITVQSISDVEVLRLEKVTARNLFNTLVMLHCDDHLRFVIHYQSPSVASCKLKQNWIQEAHGCHHGDSSVLQFHGSAALESGDITISGKSDGIPETDGCLQECNRFIVDMRLPKELWLKLILKTLYHRSILEGLAEIHTH